MNHSFLLHLCFHLIGFVFLIHSVGMAVQNNLNDQVTLSQNDQITFTDSDTSAVKPHDPDISEYLPMRQHVNDAFDVGEHLTFEIAYGVIKAGTATMSIPDTQWVRGRPCYHVVTTAESNKFFDPFFKVRDRVETFIDMEGIFPWKFEKHIREGKYQSDRYVEYDQYNHLVIMDGKDTLEVEPYIQGILSSFYYVRTIPLEVGKSFDIDNYGDGKIYPLKILVHEKERVKVPAGTFDCIVVEPVMRAEGIFNQTGRMAIWLTDDERRIPVLMKSKVIIGSIDVRLKEIKIQPF
ncbi:DUF3108 domain-containing protein [bacterium]|nr:DUF3108 domain-containing protein [bacterium]